MNTVFKIARKNGLSTITNINTKRKMIFIGILSNKDLITKFQKQTAKENSKHDASPGISFKTHMSQVFVLFLILFSFVSCGSVGTFNDKTPGVIEPELQKVFNQIQDLAVEYGHYEFANRMNFVDLCVENSKKANDILKDCKNYFSENECFLSLDSYAKAYNLNGLRSIILSEYQHNNLSNDGILITLLHEFYHAVSDSHDDANQHIDSTIVDYDGHPFPLSIMNSAATPYVLPHWNSNKNWYLRQLFSMRLDRTWRE